MATHKILIRQVPRILFAHGYQTDHYRIHFPPTAGVMEISFLERGDAIKTYGDGRQIPLPAPGLTVSFFDSDFTMHSPAPLHSHLTVGLGVEFEKHPITKEQIITCSREAYKQGQSPFLMAILPDYRAQTPQNTGIETRIRQLIHAYSSPGSTRDLRCTGLLLDLLAEITEESVRDAMAGGSAALPPGSLAYARYGMEYIAGHLDKKLTVGEIAGHLHISEGYFSRLFKSVTGQTVIEYVNRVKLERVRDLIASRQATLREAGESVGIFDENYLSRLFKQYMGLSVREYTTLTAAQRPT